MDPATATVSIVSIMLATIALIISALQWNLAQAQTALTKKQADIAQAQYDVFLQQLNQKAELRIEIEAAAMTLDMTRNEYRATYHVLIRNSGDKTASRIYWHVFIVGRPNVTMTPRIAEGNVEKTSKITVKEDETGQTIDELTGFYEQNIYRGQAEPCLILDTSYTKGNEPDKPLELGYFLDSDIGKFPPTAFNYATGPWPSASMRMVDTGQS